MTYIIALGVIVGCAVTMVSPMLFTNTKVRGYVGVPRETFLSMLSKEGIPENISSVVFDFYKKKGRWKKFNPAPEMDINAVFEESPEDIDDTAVDLLKELHLDLPSGLDRRTWPAEPLRTTSDLAKWLYWASKHQP